MGKVKKTFNLGAITLTVEVDEPTQSWTPSAPQHRSIPTPPMGEPDGFDAHIDRPRRENYRGDYYLSQRAFDEDMSKYRKAENAVKQCNWPTREPMGNGVPAWPVPQNMPQHSGVLVGCASFSAPTTPSPKPSVVTRDAWGRFASKNTTRVASTKRDLRQKCGIVPVGAVVVDHTWNGEPIFDR